MSFTAGMPLSVDSPSLPFCVRFNLPLRKTSPASWFYDPCRHAAELDTTPPAEILLVEKMVGTWKASSFEAQFELSITKEGTFVWRLSRGRTEESVKGVFAVDQNTPAMKPDAGGTMVAEVDFSSPTRFRFQMIGGEPDDHGIVLVKD